MTTKEITELEMVDDLLLRRILAAHSKTPKELLYLETGNIPVRYILMARRINFLHYILNENEDSLLHNFFEAQLKSPVKGDWVLRVKKDLEELEINLTFLEISQTSKSDLKKIIREKVKSAAFRYLSELKLSHSKSRNIKHGELKLQTYLQSNQSDLSIRERQFIFAARSRMLDVRSNFKVGLKSTQCRRCEDAEETQEHLLYCPTLRDDKVVTDVSQYDNLLGEEIQKIIII